MRLRNLRLEHYGNFGSLHLTLDPAPGRLNLIEAPNGAGKSVLRQAFHDLLFGIDGKTTPLFPRFKGEHPLLLADALLADGEGLVFGSRYKQGRVLPDGGGPATMRLAGALGRVTPRQLEHLFALDTQRLREGGRELASGGDTLGMALLAGTGELAFAKRVRDTLEQRRDALWQARKTATPLHRANRAVEQARKALRERVRQPRQRQIELDSLAAHEAELTEARAAHDQASATVHRLGRIDRTRAALVELKDAEQWLAANPNAPMLPADLAKKLVDAQTAASLAATRLAAAERRAAEERAAAEQIVRDTVILAAEDRLRSLAERLGEIEKSAADSRGVAAQREQSDTAIAASLRELGLDPAIDAEAALRPEAVLATVRELVTRNAGLATRTDSSRTRGEQARAELDQLAEAADPADPEDLAALSALLAEIRADGDPARRMADAAQAWRAAASDAELALGAVPDWTAGAAALAALAPPDAATFDRLAAALAAAEAHAAETGRDHDRLAQERAGWRGELDALHTTPLPDEAAIARARTARDAGWRLIYQLAFAGAPDPAAEAAYADTEPLPLRFERDLRHADALADQRLLELPRVAEAERLSRRLAGSEAGLAERQAKLDAATLAARRAAEAWGAACAALGVAPESTAAELRAFLTARADALRISAAARLARAAHDALARSQSDWAARLAAVLGLPDQPLPALLAAADARIAAAAQARERRIEQQTRRSEIETRLRMEAAELRRAEVAMAKWQLEWSEALAALGRPAGENPAAIEAVLRTLDTLRRQLQERRGLQGRLDDMRRDQDAFIADIATLAAAFGLPPELDTFAATRALIARRDAASAQDGRWHEADRARQMAEEQLLRETEAAREAQDAVAALIAACGAADGDDAMQRLSRARDRARFEAELANARAVLREHGDGLTVEALREQAASLPPERMAAERQAAETALGETRARIEKAAVRANEARRETTQAAASEDAIDAAAARNAAIATQSRLMEDYLLMSVAGDMLARALRDIEDAAGGAGLRRISAAFERLTGGAYGIVGAAVKGQTVLQAVERDFPSPDEWRDIAQLSEGTRDQLYLALRFVAIEDFVAAAPPLPFVADDILQTFDDARARAALQALVGLSQHVQVIVLTHHPHLLELARDLPVHAQRL